MPVFNRNRHSGSSGVTASYTIDQSCRFNSPDGARTVYTSATGNRNLWTISFWFKLGLFSTLRGELATVFCVSSSGEDMIGFQHTSDEMKIEIGGVEPALLTARKFRDPSAWYHCVIAYDAAQGTAANRMKLYINGVEETVFTTDGRASISTDQSRVLTNLSHEIGYNSASANREFDGYLAEFALIDGTAYAASDFGESDSAGNWIPKDISVLTFGDEGFHLDFAVAPGTGNGAGTDVSGNGNHFSDSGLAANDQVLDSPTDDLENDVSNYATWNPLHNANAGTYSEGNLKFQNPAALWGHTHSTIAMTSGKYYFECLHFGGLGSSFPGFYQDEGTFDPDNTSWTTEPHWSSRDGSNWKHEGSTIAISSNGGSAGDLFYFAYDADTKKVWCGIAAGWMNGGDPGAGTGQMGTFSGDGPVFAALNSYQGATNYGIVNFGQQAFTGTPPTGFTKRLRTADIDAPAIKDSTKYYQTNTFTGTGSELARTLTDGAGGAVKPDLVWIKDRDTASTDHQVVDSARGATKELRINLPDAAGTVAEGLKSFDTSGYTLGTDTGYNASSSGQVGYHWVAASGAGSSNEDGSINTITTSVSQTAGFSVSTFTGTGSNATLGHGLGSVPDFILLKARAGSEEWFTWHKDIDPTAPEDKSLRIASNSAVADDPFMQDTMPTSTVMSLDGGDRMNKSGVLGVVYSWTGVEGFSKFGSYEGNGDADGTFVWLGFRPAFLLLKNFDAVSDWALFDNKRNGYNSDNPALIPNEEQADNFTNAVDLLSNGFKTRVTSNPNTAHSYIYAAFAEAPFGGDGVSQARAR
jgi:hypothetical protein